MAFNKEEWEAGMRRRYGDDWRETMREWGRRGGQVKTDKGTARMSPDKIKEISLKGVEARRIKNAA